MNASLKRLLLVEDDPSIVIGLRMNLEREGYEVELAEDGQLGLERARSGQFDLMILDIMLPKLNGYDACRRIREQPWARNAVIIALTGWGQEDDKRRSLEAGFDHHLVKPVEPAALMSLLRPEPSLPLPPLSRPSIRGERGLKE